MLKRIVILLISSQPFLLIGCNNQSLEHVPESETVWGETTYGLRCTIDVDKPTISKSDSLVVVVQLQNVSDKQINRKCIAAFTMADCWCPVDLPGKNVNPRELIFLEPGKFINFQADLSKLGWDRNESSIWPSRAFHQIVPSGNHEFQLQFELLGSAEPQWVRSNAVAITIID